MDISVRRLAFLLIRSCFNFFQAALRLFFAYLEGVKWLIMDDHWQH